MRRRAALRHGLVSRAHRIRVGASLSLCAVLATVLLLPLHGTRAASPSAADGATLAAAVASATPALATRAGAPDADGPLHDAADCPQCRALAQARSAVTAAPPLARTFVLIVRAPRVLDASPLPARPDLATAHPRAPPISFSILAA
jgi:hypothetical protein